MRITLVGRLLAAAAIVAMMTAVAPALTPAGAQDASRDASAAASLKTATPIKHLVVIFPENESFDHYFGTYPNAANPPGEPPFHALPNTPKVDGLTPALLTHNPNLYQPRRIDRANAFVCNNLESTYPQMQQEYNGSRADRFIQVIRTFGPWTVPAHTYCPLDLAMRYFDGNTITALWNYAQHYSMSDHAFAATFGQSTPGALNLIGTTAGVACGPSAHVYLPTPACGTGVTLPVTTTPAPVANAYSHVLHDDVDPLYDKCSSTKLGVAGFTGPNIGDLLNARGITWGWFEGGFANCKAIHSLKAIDRLLRIKSAQGIVEEPDYVPHHEPFQFWASTANPNHLPPSSVAMIGHTDQANHQYDLTSFWAAVKANNLPAVSFLKPPAYQDGHPGYSDPLDLQSFLVTTINRLQHSPAWKSMLIVINFDDGGGWYDQVRGPLVHPSATQYDTKCGKRTPSQPARCGYGVRLPYLVISPYAKRNHVDHTVIDQSSTRHFIEANWLQGQRLPNDPFDRIAHGIGSMLDFKHPRKDHLYLNPNTGNP